jgi:hypothetical protein
VALYVVNYLSHTKTLGIYFRSLRRPILETFIPFPVLPNLLAMSDANWGPQDSTASKSNVELPFPCLHLY